MTRRQSTRPGESASRPAFTLVEVLIALGLSVLLITAIYSAIDLHYRVQSAGRGEIAFNQLTRSLIRIMNEDFSSVVMQIPEKTSDEDAAAADESAASSGTSGSSSSTGSTTDTPLMMGGLEEGIAPLTFGIVGTSEVLHLTVSRPSRELAYTPLYSGDVTGRASDSIIISYGLAPVETQRFSLLETPTGHPGTGFGRRIRDLYSSEVIEDVLETSDVIAGEIVQVRFRYFDGAAWADSWDSQALGLLPTSIEVTFGFWSDPPKKGSWNYRPMQRGTISPFVHRFYVPVSVPFTDTAI